MSTGIDFIDVLELVPYMESSRAMDPFTDPGPEATGRALERMIARARERKVKLDLIVREPYAKCISTGSETESKSVGRDFEHQHEELRQQHPGFCEQVMMFMQVQPDGNAYPCCKAPEELKIGNVFRDGVDAVWNSRKARQLRRRMYTGDYPEPCQECLFMTYTRGTEKSPAKRASTTLRQLGWRLGELRPDRETRRAMGRAVKLPRFFG